MEAVRALHTACSRTRTFLWMVLALMSPCCRADLARVSSYIRFSDLMICLLPDSSICSTARGLIWISSPPFACVCVRSFSSASTLVLAWSVLPTASRRPKRAGRCLRSRNCSPSRPSRVRMVKSGRIRMAVANKDHFVLRSEHLKEVSFLVSFFSTNAIIAATT